MTTKYNKPNKAARQSKIRNTDAVLQKRYVKAVARSARMRRELFDAIAERAKVLTERAAPEVPDALP